MLLVGNEIVLKKIIKYNVFLLPTKLVVDVTNNGDTLTGARPGR